MNVGNARERRLRIAGHGDELRTHSPDQRQDRDDFLGLARVRDGEHQVLCRDHAEIAVTGLGGVHEKGGRAGAGERCGDLRRYMARFSHPCHDHAARRVVDQLTGGGEVVIEPRTQGIDRARFDLQHLARERDQLVVVQVFGHSVLAVSGCRRDLQAILNLLRLNAAKSGARQTYRFCVVT